MADKFLPKLSQNLLNILDDDEYYDITIEVGNDPYVKIFRAHMVILNYRSPYLKRILSTNKKHSDGTLVHIKLPSILPETFHEILRYIYGGRISLEKYNISDIINMLIAADKLCLPELVFHLQTFFIEDNTIWTEENFDLVYKTSFENVSFLELQNHCNDLISKEPDKIFKSPDFSSVPEKLLISLIKNDNLQMEEVQIWENVLKWGFAQHPELPPDSTILSKDEFNVLKNTIQQCIPFIKFINLSSREFFDKVLPYKKVLPKELKNELLNYFLDPNRESKSRVNKEVKSESQSNKESPSETRSNKEFPSESQVNQSEPQSDKEFPSESQANQSEPQSDKESPSESQVNQPDPQMNKGSQSESQTNEECQPELQTKKETSSESQSESQMIKEIKSNIESKIITNKHAELISGWIVDSSSFYSTLFGWVYGSNQYEFKLLFRGSRDGFTPPNFHNLCDNQTSTIMIIKVKDSNEILGGYNPIAWKNDYSNGITKDSFIFSFENENHILSRVKDENSAIKNSCYCVPSFGESDLTLSGYNYHYSYCKKGSYEKPIRNTEDIFSVEEFEVFKIHIKN